MRFHRQAGTVPRRLGILAGSFNPPTRAHIALMEAAAPQVDEVLCVLPEIFPHKTYHGATLDQRLGMLEAARPSAPPCSIGVAQRGLFIEIARECRPAYPMDVELWFLCGRDAADRIVTWDYGDPGAIDRMLDEFGLLVAARRGRYEPPARLAHRIHDLDVAPEVDEISSTEVRLRIHHGEPWEHLVPPQLVETVRRIYR